VSPPGHTPPLILLTALLGLSLEFPSPLLSSGVVSVLGPSPQPAPGSLVVSVLLPGCASMFYNVAVLIRPRAWPRLFHPQKGSPNAFFYIPKVCFLAPITLPRLFSRRLPVSDIESYLRVVLLWAFPGGRAALTGPLSLPSPVPLQFDSK